MNVCVYVCVCACVYERVGGARPTQYARGDGRERRPTSSSILYASARTATSLRMYDDDENISAPSASISTLRIHFGKRSTVVSGLNIARAKYTKYGICIIIALKGYIVKERRILFIRKCIIKCVLRKGKRFHLTKTR